MCFVIHLSANSELRVAQADDQPFYLEPAIGDGPLHDDDAPILQYPHRYLLRVKGGCSCCLRHVAMKHEMTEEGDWFSIPPAGGFTFEPPGAKEPPGDVEATRAIYRYLKPLVLQGIQIDMVNIWHGIEIQPVRELDVSFSKVDEASFRFFEDHKFVLRP